MASISILVVLYNKEITSSKTLESLSKYSWKNNINITIFNNGPRKVDKESILLSELKEKFKKVSFLEFLENKPLSKVYNDFIDSNPDSDYYTILDDDSWITMEFIEAINAGGYDILVPRIKSIIDNKLYYPTISGNPITEDKSVCVSDLMSIGSGLTLSKELSESYKKYFNNKVFDESFALYGIDTSFFLRARRIHMQHNKKIKIYCQGEIRHSLSRVEGTISSWRRQERLYDTALTARHYPEYVKPINLMKDIIKYLIKMDLNAVKISVLYFIIGKHPRC